MAEMDRDEWFWVGDQGEVRIFNLYDGKGKEPFEDDDDEETKICRYIGTSPDHWGPFWYLVDWDWVLNLGFLFHIGSGFSEEVVVVGRTLRGEIGSILRQKPIHKTNESHGWSHFYFHDYILDDYIVNDYIVNVSKTRYLIVT